MTLPNETSLVVRVHELAKINTLLEEKIKQLEATEALLRRTNERLILPWIICPLSPMK
jgi:hypothetical protein